MMKTISDKMICPNCRVEMNHHCDKLVYASDSQGTARMDEGLGEVLQEFHTCPKCAGVASRPAGRLMWSPATASRKIPLRS